jgi:hypothetical protein
MKCGCLGCTSDATLWIRHPKHGRRPVCNDHQNSYPIDGFVEGSA